MPLTGFTRSTLLSLSCPTRPPTPISAPSQTSFSESSAFVSSPFFRSHSAQALAPASARPASLILERQRRRSGASRTVSSWRTRGALPLFGLAFSRGLPRKSVALTRMGSYRQTLAFGGADLTAWFGTLLRRSAFPHGELNVVGNPLDFKLVQGLKEKLCTLNEVRVSHVLPCSDRRSTLT